MWEGTPHGVLRNTVPLHSRYPRMVSPDTTNMNHSRDTFRAGTLALLLTSALLGGPGCGPAEPLPESLGSQGQTLSSDNGLAMNGLAMNGLNSSEFEDWFQQQPEFANMVMSYLMRCALGAEQSRTYTDPTTGTVYTWPGNLGLAPDWSSGSPATTLEQQLISACMAAHANRFGLHLTISVLGRDASGTAIDRTVAEQGQYSVREGCFFGNFFTQQGLFIGSDKNTAPGEVAPLRACQVSSSSTEFQCAPLVHVGACQDYCTRDTTGPFYESCTYEGVTYAPLTTRISVEDYDLLLENYQSL